MLGASGRSGVRGRVPGIHPLPVDAVTGFRRGGRRVHAARDDQLVHARAHARGRALDRGQARGAMPVLRQPGDLGKAGGHRGVPGDDAAAVEALTQDDVVDQVRVEPVRRGGDDVMGQIVALVSRRVPLKAVPIGVRRADTRTASGMSALQLRHERAAQQFSGFGLRQFGAEHDGVGCLGGTEPVLDPLLDLGGIPLADDDRDEPLGPTRGPAPRSRRPRRSPDTRGARPRSRRERCSPRPG
jgi:hypothetical protein